MNKVEKAIFLHLRQYQYTTDEWSEITKTYGTMTPEEKNQYSELFRELHRIWNYINSQPVLNVRPDDGVNTVQLYHEKIHPVSPLILKVIEDFDFTVKDTITESEKAAYIAILGEDHYNTNMGHIQVIPDLKNGNNA